MDDTFENYFFHVIILFHKNLLENFFNGLLCKIWPKMLILDRDTAITYEDAETEILIIFYIVFL